MDRLDITPTWAGLAPGLIAVLEGGSKEGQHVARAELLRMAVAADEAIARASRLIRIEASGG